MGRFFRWWLNWFVVSFERPASFAQDGEVYDHATRVYPEGGTGKSGWFEYFNEPRIIAQVPTRDGGTVEVHAYASRYTPQLVNIFWQDETITHQNLWVPAANVRRPVAGEWAGRYSPR